MGFRHPVTEKIDTKFSCTSVVEIFSLMGFASFDGF